MLGDPGWPDAPQNRRFKEMPEIKANKTRVFDLMDHLKRAFEEFCNTYHEELPYMDVFMGAHNFHKLIIKDIADRAKLTGQARAVFFSMSVDTYMGAIEEMMRKEATERE